MFGLFRTVQASKNGLLKSRDKSLLHPGHIAKLAGCDLKESLHTGPRGRLKARFSLNRTRNSLRQNLTCAERHIEPACKKALKNLEIGRRKPHDSAPRQGESGVRLRSWNTCRKDVGSKGSRP